MVSFVVKMLVVGLFCVAAVCGVAGADDVLSLRLAVRDLIDTYGSEYRDGQEYLLRLDGIERDLAAGDASVESRLERLRRDALLANPLLDFDRLLVVKRAVKPFDKYPSPAKYYQALGLPRNHQSNSSLPRLGYDNEISVLSPVSPSGTLDTFYRSKYNGYVGEIDLHFEGDRLMFTEAGKTGWKVFEIGVDGTGFRRVSPGGLDDVDFFDACYLPNGDVMIGSTASYQAVPCWHGVPEHRVSNLYLMSGSGKKVRQLCYDQDNDLYPAVMGNGQIIFSRWEYAGIRHEYGRQLFVMNPDGTGQRSVYGTNSWWPNSIYYPRSVPGHPTKVLAILSGYHGAPRQGELILFDTAKGWYWTDGVVERMADGGRPVEPRIKEALVLDSWPKFLHPYPLSDKYFITACQPTQDHDWGIYLVDVFDNMTLIREEKGYALLEPVPLGATETPPVIPSRVDPDRDDAVVYLHDVYRGPGLHGVPRGTVKKLRIFSYDFGYPGLAGSGKIGMGGPWEVVRVLGTVPVDEDGSVSFRAPANTPLSVQPIDEDGKALQLMRSWFTAMPGEVVSCVGCHEQPKDTAGISRKTASKGTPVDIDPWYGPVRGFDFEREVQPVLDKYCVGCHDGGMHGRSPDLRSERSVEGYRGQLIHPLPLKRIPLSAGDEIAELFGERIPYSPSYDELLPYIRRMGHEDGLDLLAPGEYHANTSELVKMLEEGHHGVQLDGEAWDRLVTWIDLDAPCHGTWNEVYPVPLGADRRRLELRRRFGGPDDDPELVAAQYEERDERVVPKREFLKGFQTPTVKGWPFDGKDAQRRQAGRQARTLKLDGDVNIDFVRIPAGEFVMGETDVAVRGSADERQPRRTEITHDFWMATSEVTNRQLKLFDASHESGYSSKHGQTKDDPGARLDGFDQPAVHVSWERAEAFCRWLSDRTGLDCKLPTENQWEYACRAGTATPLFYGGVDTDFSEYANLADMSMAGETPFGDKGLEWSAVGWSVGKPFVTGVDDGAEVTTDVKSYRPNAWGLYDMHGNAAEWTRSAYKDSTSEKTVRGGSWIDRPHRARSAYRGGYPAWQAVHDVGFRVVIEGDSGLLLLVHTE
jgi:formylglycine-generating enzyme required for sulfatase activity